MVNTALGRLLALDVLLEDGVEIVFNLGSDRHVFRVFRPESQRSFTTLCHAAAKRFILQPPNGSVGSAWSSSRQRVARTASERSSKNSTFYATSWCVKTRLSSHIPLPAYIMLCGTSPSRTDRDRAFEDYKQSADDKVEDETDETTRLQQPRTSYSQRSPGTTKNHSHIRAAEEVLVVVNKLNIKYPLPAIHLTEGEREWLGCSKRYASKVSISQFKGNNIAAPIVIAMVGCPPMHNRLGEYLYTGNNHRPSMRGG